MDEIDVIGKIADKRKAREREGVIQQVHAASVTVKPMSSNNVVECAYNNVNPALVGKRCTYLWIPLSKKYVISHIFNAPQQTDITVPAGSSRNDHTLYDNIGGQIHHIVEKPEPVDDDELLINDSEDEWRPKRVKRSLVAAGGAIRFFEGDATSASGVGAFNIGFSTPLFSEGDVWDSMNPDRLVAPENGLYHYSLSLHVELGAPMSSGEFVSVEAVPNNPSIHGESKVVFDQAVYPTGTEMWANLSGMLYMLAGEYITFACNSSTGAGTVFTVAQASFMMHKGVTI
jgi:hypothetical protein